MSADICCFPATLAETRQVQPPLSLTPISLMTMPQSMSEKPKYWRRPLSAFLVCLEKVTVRPYGVSHWQLSYCLLAWQTSVALSSACCSIEVGADSLSGAAM